LGNITPHPLGSLYVPPNPVMASESYSDDFEEPDQSFRSVEHPQARDSLLASSFERQNRQKSVVLQVFDEEDDMEDASMIENIDNK
jgi:hypothetical protein